MGVAMDKYTARLAEVKKSPGYWGAFIVDLFARSLCAEMERQGVSRAELARRAGVSRQRVTKMLAGDSNLTAESMAKFALCLGQVVHVRLAEPGERPLWLTSNADDEIAYVRAPEAPALREAPSRIALASLEDDSTNSIAVEA